MLDLDKTEQAYFEEVNLGILRYVGHGHRVLDVGCGNGALGEAIRKKGNSVIGIERHPKAFEKAQARLDTVIQADIQDFLKVAEQLKGEIFDRLVFSDVLEHLADPLSVLRYYLSFLRKGGIVLISVPNAVEISNRFRIFFGNFDYSDTGVMDRTHLRFFTFKSAQQVMSAANVSIKRIDCTPGLARIFLPLVKSFSAKATSPAIKPNPRAIIDSPVYKFYERFIYPIELRIARLWMEGFAFRIIIVGAKSFD